MHIVFFIGRMVRGGAERVIYILANNYAKKGWDVDIALLLKNEVDYNQFPLDKSIRIIDLSESDSSYIRNAFKWIKSIRAYVNHTKPNCIVSFVGRINALVLTSTIGLHVPVIVSERNDPRHDGRGRIMQAYCSLIYQRAAAVIFQTEYEKSCFSNSLNKKSYVIPNPVSVSNVGGIKPNPFEISTAGRLEPQKNHKMLIDAISIVKETHPAVRCEIYGEGSLQYELEERIKQLGLENHVHLPGTKTDINMLVSRSSIFVMTSNYEGLSNALIEAMMLGKACITTDYCGSTELIHDNENGLIVHRGEARELADKIIKLFEDGDLRSKLSINAKKTAEKYNSKTVLKDWERTITQAIGESKEFAD